MESIRGCFFGSKIVHWLSEFKPTLDMKFGEYLGGCSPCVPGIHRKKHEKTLAKFHLAANPKMHFPKEAKFAP